MPEYHVMLASDGGGEIPPGDEWVYEIKFDGYRGVATVADGTCSFHSRSGKGLSYPKVATAIAAAVKKDCILDGEICSLDANGRPDFQLMQNAKKGRAPLVYFAFDVLEVEGQDVRHWTLEARRSLLAELVTESPDVRLSVQNEDGAALLRFAVEQRLEGIVAKRRGSTYTFKRSKDWLKIKLKGRQEYVVVGYTDGEGRRAGAFGALVLAAHDENDKLVHVGNVGTGWDDAEHSRLWCMIEAGAEFHAAQGNECPFDAPPKGLKATWITPGLVVEVEFVEKTADGILRNPSYKGQRHDKSWRTVTLIP